MRERFKTLDANYGRVRFAAQSILTSIYQAKYGVKVSIKINAEYNGNKVFVLAFFSKGDLPYIYVESADYKKVHKVSVKILSEKGFLKEKYSPEQLQKVFEQGYIRFCDDKNKKVVIARIYTDKPDSLLF